MPKKTTDLSKEDEIYYSKKKDVERRYFHVFYQKQGNLKVKCYRFKSPTFKTKKEAILEGETYCYYMHSNVMIFRRPDRSYTFAAFTGWGVNEMRVAQCFGGVHIKSIIGFSFSL